MGFFDDTHFGKVEFHRKRLNERFERIIARNQHHIHGRSILDLGSHNGLWSWAALKNGAKFAFGIEGRKSVIDSGLHAFAEFDDSRYQFVNADVFEGIFNLPSISTSAFDTVLCLGIYYHIMDHYRMMQLMTGLNPNAIIMDSGFINSDLYEIKLEFEDTAEIANAIPERPGQTKRIVGIPSLGALKAMAESCGYTSKIIEWRKDEVGDLEVVKDYFNYGSGKRNRYTIVLEPADV